MAHDDRVGDHPGRRVNGKMILGIVIAVLALIFVLENTDETKVEFLGFNFSTGTWLMLVIFFVAGMILGWLLSRRRAER